MTASLRNLFEKLTILNVDVVLMYATISVIMTLSFMLIPSRAFALILANVAFIIASYILNVIADHAEDSVNGRRALPLNKDGVRMLSVLLLCGFTVTYAIQGGIRFFVLAVLMSGLSVWYSFPRHARLKNLFFIKNAVPAVCWYLSLSTLYYLGGGMYYYTIPQVLYGITPFLMLFFAFEIMWDLPDRAGDKHAGVRTLPTLIGFWPSKLLVVLLLVAVVFVIPTILNKTAVSLIIMFILFVPETTKKITYHAFLSALMVFAWIGYALIPLVLR